MDPRNTATATESVRQLLYRWLFIPLTTLLMLTAMLGYPVVLHPVTEALDWALMDSARSLARLINASESLTLFTVSSANDTMLRGDQYDRIYYSVHAGDGTLLAGDAALQPLSIPQKGDVYYDSVIRAEPVRVAAMTIDRDGSGLMVLVAETTIKRTRLARQILTGVILVETILIALVALLVSIGIKKGLAPLERLRSEIEARSLKDLGPVPETHAPVEAQPLVRAINGLLDQLSAVLSAQQQFVANAAHQLRTPLAGLRMQVEYALRQEDAQEWRRALATLKPVTERTVRLVQQLLALARTEANAGGMSPMNRTDLAAIVEEAAGHCMPKAIERDIDLGLELMPAPILGDALLLGELVTNLIDNALTYSTRGTRVTVRTSARTDRCSIEVEDEGPGIAVAERPKVFERFYRTIGSPGEGCGLGLAIVQEIAELHQAQVLIHNAQGRTGTLVVVLFPRAASGSDVRRPQHDQSAVTA